MTTLDPRALTWTALLSKWIEFARASVAAPPDSPGDRDGRRWQACVPAVINLQAVTFALGEIDQLDADERALARDRAEILITRAVEELDDAWAGEPPGSLREIAADAERALAATAFLDSLELIWEGPGTMVMPIVDVPEAGKVEASRASLAVMMPGTIVMPGEPVAWWTNFEHGEGIEVAGCTRRPTNMPSQVYRMFDADGRMTRDVVMPVIADVGDDNAMPLIVPLFMHGRAIGHFPMEADEWLAKQRELMVGIEIPVDSQVDAEAP